MDVLGKARQLGPYTFFATFSGAEFYWTDIIKTVAKQYGETLTDEQINNMTWNEKCKYLKRNPVTVARQIDYRFNKLWGDVILSGLHPIAQILNYDDSREFQGRGTEHCHAGIHVKDAPQVDVDSDEKCIEFSDKYVTCAIPDPIKYPELHALVMKLQTY